MKVITFNDICNLNISFETCYQWAEEIIKNKKEVLLPPKISIKPEDGVFCNVMPSIMNHEAYGRIGGVKIVTRYPERKPSLDGKLLLFNAGNGDFLAVMDANWITAMRTGAVAAHSIKLLAKKDFKEIGILGLGNTARATLLILAAVMPDREFHIKLLKYKGQERSFAERFDKFDKLRFDYVDTAEELVKESDVVISAATYLPTDLCADEYFDEGVLVVPIHTLGFTNCDLFFDKIYADDYGHVCHFKNFSKFKKFAEVSDIVNGTVAGRESDKERILAYNIGISAQDVYFASKIYELATEKMVLDEIDLQEPAEKFWI